MKKMLKVAALLLLLGLVVHMLRLAVSSGTFKKLSPHGGRKAQVIRELPGAEDLTIDPETGIAYVSCFDRRKNMQGERVKGAIYALDFQAEPPVIKDLTAGWDQEDFSPHGISLYRDPADGSRRLFVINHRLSGHFVEIFQPEDNRLLHLETIDSPHFISPNDVVGTGKHEFYFTNDHDVKGWKAVLKDLFMIGGGQVGYFDGMKVKILDRHIPYANGINTSQDGKYLFVASTTGKKILVYERENFLKVADIPCGTGVDNIELDASGNLWVGAHPKLFAFMGHAKDAEKLSPSQILKIEFEDPSKPATVTEFYLNDGTPLSGSSVAAVYGNYWLMGTVFEDGVMVGTMNDE